MVRSPDADGPSVRIDLLDSPPQYSIDDLCKEVTRALTLRLFDPEFHPKLFFGRYEVRSVLGAGGYGGVLLGWDPGLDREVAIKIYARDPEIDAALLLSEARSLASLSHPNVLTVYDFGGQDGRLYLVLEYVDGGTLYDYALEGGPRSWRSLVEVFAGIARGVAAAHDSGVVHGDLKPDNVLLHDDLRPRVADFGLARRLEGRTLLPDAVGTRPYAAPELLAGQVRDAGSDQWAFFVMLCQCIDGKLPIIDTDARELPSTDEQMLRAIESWAGPSSLRGPIPAALAEVLRVGLSIEPRERFPDMHAVARALDELLAGEGASEVGPMLVKGSSSGVAVVRSTTGDLDVRSGKAPWWKKGGVVALLLSLGLGLLGQGYVLGHRETANTEAREPVADSTERSKSGKRGERTDRPACVATGVPVAPDASLRTICQMLKTEGLEATLDLWHEIASSREDEAATPSDWLKLASDSTSLALTIMREANDTADPHALRQAATRLAQHATGCSNKATTDETADAISQIEAALMPLMQSSN